MIKNSLIKLSVALLSTGFLASCGSKPAEQQSVVTDTASVSESTEILNAVDELLTKLPRPSEIPNLIAMTGAEYESKLINAPENAEKIMDNNTKACFTIGVLGADVGYMAAYDKGNEAVKTFVVGKKLADKVGVSAAFDQSIVGRVEKNLANKDSLVNISDASIKSSTGILQSNEQLKEAALVATGAFIEGLYINCGLIHDYPPTGLPQKEQDRILVPLVNNVIQQEKTLGSLIELLKKVNTSNDAELSAVVAKLEGAQAIYAKANWPQKMADNKGNLIPTEKDIHDLAIAITEIRQSLTQ